MAPVSSSQIDPDHRQLLQAGYNQPIEGKGPISGYAYYHLNEPGFVRTNLTLRLVVAPVFLDSELGIAGALGPRTDLGIGLAGGGFADTFSEVRGGQFLKEESFTGHGGEASLSAYHLFNPDSRVPLYGIVRGSFRKSVYERDSDTFAGFQLPPDLDQFHSRVGVRYGGREPLMLPDLAMELSAWYEGRFRVDSASYGFAGDRRIRASSHQLWARGLLIYTLPELRHNLGVSLTGGVSLRPDRFSAYRLGSVLPMAAEFPLTLPGYYFQELSAQRFALLSGQYVLPLNGNKRWSLAFSAATAFVDYLPGLAQPGNWHTGLGGGLAYRSPDGRWHLMAGYAYGVDAIRTDGRGANSVGILCQFDFGARERARVKSPTPDIPDKSRGLFEFFQRLGF
jgi:hypothetical protein